MKDLKAELSVFFALTTAIIFAVFLCVLESARMNAARLHLTIAVNSSMESLFSQYHKKLWEEYRLLGLEHYSERQLTDEMAGFLTPYLDVQSWMPMKLKSIESEEIKMLTDNEGEIFENEVLDYMKYGIAASIWELADIELFSSGLREGTAVEEISDLYDGHAKEAAEIERTMEAIDTLLTGISENHREAVSRVEVCDGRGFISRAEDIIRALKDVPGHVEKYEKQADRLMEGLKASAESLEERKKAGNISASTYELLMTDIREYESYVSADGERRVRISGFKERAVPDAEFFEDLINEAEEIMDYIAEWEPADEDDELDEEALWSPVVSALNGYDPMTMGVSFGIADKEKMGKLESLKELFSGDLLGLVMPPGAEISDEVLKLEESPGLNLAPAENIDRLSVIDSVYLAEYMSSFTGYFGRGIYDDSSIKGSGRLEQEYIIFGRQNDRDNLKAAVKRLTLMRGGLNLIYLYSDADRRNEARTLALMVTGAAGFTPLAAVVTFLIMSLWASGQAVMDVKSLLAGGKVPFIHNRDTFDLTLEGLLDMSGGQPVNGADNAGGAEVSDKGLQYKDYLKIFLFFDMGSTFEYRCMDIIQMNLKTAQEDFQMDRLAYSMKARAAVDSRHVFSETWIAKAFGGKDESVYGMSASTYYSY